MKATELRMGNLVYVDNEIIEVWEVSDSSINYHYMEGKDIAIEELKPIPLTVEWLEKFGFENIKDDVYRFGYYEYFMGGLCFDGVEIFNAKRIDYVHQLQNLYFALTEEELTLK